MTVHRIPRACSQCGRPNCTVHIRRRPPRRAYSDTAAYRAARAALLERDGPICAQCRQPGDPDAPKGDPNSLELAHLVPHVLGGAFVLENLALAHPGACNRALELVGGE